MKRLHVICIGLVILFTVKVYPQQSDHLQDIHKYLTYQAWELVKNQHPEVINSEMNLRIGHWQDGTLNGTGPWQTGKVMTGAYREDEEDPVYKHSGLFVSATHFWNADYGDYVTFNPPPYTYNYANSYQKILAYWYGNINNEPWLELGPFFYYFTPYFIKVKYNNLAEAYRNHSNFLVTHWYDILLQRWIEENPPVPVIPYLLENSPGYSQAEAVALLNRVCWEIVGRICHLTEDSGVPAHAHNDPHPVSDYFEDIYIPAHYQEYTWTNALNQGGLININNKQYPLRFAMFTTNQIADRFKSDDACGDLTFPYPAQYSVDNYESIINPVYQSVQNIGICEGPESVANLVAQKSFVYSIRSAAGFLWYVYNQFNIQTQLPPVIHGFTKNLPDTRIYRGETLKMNCSASGSNLNYNWFYKVCDIDNWCTMSINGLSFNRSDREYWITNNSFQNRWTCNYYDSICNNNLLKTNGLSEDPLHFYIGLKVSNQFGQDTKYYNMNNVLNFSPVNAIRPPDPPIVGCPILFTLDTMGFKCENNILHESPDPKNVGRDVEDKIIIATKPYADTADNTIQFAVTESSLDHNYFDKFSVLKIAHPEVFSLAITKNNNIVLIDLKNVTSPKNAVISGTDVTAELKFDSAFNKGVKGREKEIITAQYPGANFFDTKDKLIHEINKINNPVNTVLSGIRDSIALILDPSESDESPSPYAKREAGYISVTDTAGNKNLEESNFSRRQRRSLCIIPVMHDNEVSRAELNFKQGFNLSYLAVARIFYDGFILEELKLTEAENSITGDIIKSISKSDDVYAEMDSSSFIILKFENSDEKLPRGWVYDYVLTVEGRSVEPGSDDIINRSGNNVSTAENNPEKFLLEQNYPNPFNPVTVINYSIPSDVRSQSSEVKLAIYDNLGREVFILVNGNQKTGNYSVIFDGSNLPSGFYYCRLIAGKFISIRKMALIK